MKLKLRHILLTKGLFCATGTAQAQSVLNRIDDWSEASGWEGVGLLQIGTYATCTGALIESDLVLTAAHCVFDDGGKLIEPNLIEFRAAWRDGQAISRRVGTHVLANAGYHPSKKPDGDSIYHDMALLKLDQPISPQTARPFKTGHSSGEGANISVVSYGAGRNDAAAMERDCHVARNYDGVYAMTCSIVPGSSGSPVFAIRNGTPEIVSVISALGPDGTAFGMDVDAHIRQMRADFRAGTGVYPAPVVARRRVAVGADNTETDLPRRLSVGQAQEAENGPVFLRP
ncbi:MAG: trypsin-like serine protease [Planctomycetes bacterium]|nr:trypsin-like serine protease [Planctomycetota bacterium]